MAKQKEGVYEQIIAAATVEFLEKGFADASLRTIAQNAQTSTSSIYTRFQDKAGLFQAIVSPIAEEFISTFYQVQEIFHQSDPARQEDILYEYSTSSSDNMIHYIYDHYDVFKLLLTCSPDHKAEDFINQLVNIEVDYTLKYLDVIKENLPFQYSISRNLLHIISSSYFSGLFEIVIHNMSKEEALTYIHQLERFYHAGCFTLFHPETKEFESH